jgi:hypothetical protein
MSPIPAFYRNYDGAEGYHPRHLLGCYSLFDVCFNADAVLNIITTVSFRYSLRYASRTRYTYLVSLFNRLIKFLVLERIYMPLIFLVEPTLTKQVSSNISRPEAAP